MGKVDRLHNRLDSFAALLWALGIVLAKHLTHACRPSITPPPYTKHVLIWSKLVQFSTKTLPPLIPSTVGIFKYALDLD